MNMSKVSVIMPIYNAANYLHDALKSLISQTYENIEIICVDDGSSDCSVYIVRDFMKNDTRISLLFQKEESKGAALARNLGLQNATGKYLLFLDADDLFEPNLIADTVQKAEETNVDIVLFDAYTYDTLHKTDLYNSNIIHTNRLQPNMIFSPEDYKDDVFSFYAGAPWNHLFRTELIRTYNLRFHSVHIADDIGFVHSAYACAKKVYYLNKRYVHYRRDAVGNQTSKYTCWPESGYLPYVYLKEELSRIGVYEKYKISFVKDFIDHALYYLGKMETFEAFSTLYLALKSQYFEMLDVYCIDEEDLGETYSAFRKSIQNQSALDFLVTMKNKSYYSGYGFWTPLGWNNGVEKKIILYGAGFWGKKVYAQLLDEANMNVIHWVDRNYTQYGGCIENPDDISYKADMVFVSILNKETFLSVYNFLIRMGTSKEKIKWIGGEYDDILLENQSR